MAVQQPDQIPPWSFVEDDHSTTVDPLEVREVSEVLPTVSQVRREMSLLHPRLAQSIARMEVTNPDVLRVTPASCAFESFAAALRTRCSGCGSRYPFSFMVRPPNRLSSPI
eukprot:Skav223658  [mRNA]  locus=scaffold1275:64097:66456:- [translate_table: standard]